LAVFGSARDTRQVRMLSTLTTELAAFVFIDVEIDLHPAI
jgi:hypothetical protein